MQTSTHKANRSAGSTYTYTDKCDPTIFVAFEEFHPTIKQWNTIKDEDVVSFHEFGSYFHKTDVVYLDRLYKLYLGYINQK